MAGYLCASSNCYLPLERSGVLVLLDDGGSEIGGTAGKGERLGHFVPLHQSVNNYISPVPYLCSHS